MTKFVRNSLLAALLLAVAPAQAAIQSYTFSGILDSGAYINETFSGGFSFDDAVLNNSGAEWLSLSALSMSFLGNSYTALNAAATPEVAFLDGTLLGVSYSVNSSDPQFSLIAGYDNASQAYFAYDTAAGLSGAGSVTFAAAVPEPETYAMLLAGLGLLGFAARRRKISGRIS